jgi:hypothetical protein
MRELTRNLAPTPVRCQRKECGWRFLGRIADVLRGVRLLASALTFTKFAAPALLGALATKTKPDTNSLR